jgi:lectin, mannose-binding 2
LTYHKDNFLSLELQYKKEDEWTGCFNVSNVTLPTVTYLGFSAHTGEVTGIFPLAESTKPAPHIWLDFHDVIKVETKTIFYSGNPKISSNMKKRDPAEGGGKKGTGVSREPIRKPRKSDSFVMAFARVLAVLVIMLVGYFVWTAYRVHHGQEPMYGRRHHY